MMTKSPEFVLVTEPPPRMVSFNTLGGIFRRLALPAAVDGPVLFCALLRVFAI